MSSIAESMWQRHCRLCGKDINDLVKKLNKRLFQICIILVLFCFSLCCLGWSSNFKTTGMPLLSRLKYKAASYDLDGERGARVSVIIPVAANEKLRVRIFKTMGEWLAHRL